MEYRRERDVIQAGFAYNAWHLLKHYEELTVGAKPSTRYEATLTLCVLQSLLTNCYELYRSLRRSRSGIVEVLDRAVASLLVDPDVSISNTFPEVINGKSLLEHLRNAMSHPRAKATDPLTTGYVTVPDATNIISRISFTDSPDLNYNGNVTARGRELTGGDVAQARIFTIELPLARVTGFTEELALLLAQPILGNWDKSVLSPLLP